MPAPKFVRPVMGTAPNQYVSSEADVAALNVVIEQLWLAIASGADEEVISDLVLQLQALSSQARVAAQEAALAKNAAELAALSRGHYDSVAEAEQAHIDGDLPEGATFTLTDGEFAQYYRILSGIGEIIPGLRVPLVTAYDAVSSSVSRSVSLARSGIDLEFFSGDDDPDDVTVDEAGATIRSISAGVTTENLQADFYVSDSDPSLVFTDDVGRMVGGFRDGNAVYGHLIPEFFGEDQTIPDFPDVSEDGYVLSGYFKDGSSYGGFNGGTVPTTPFGLPAGSPYQRDQSVFVQRAFSDLYSTPHADFITGFADIYPLYDQMLTEFADSVDVDVLGQDEWDNDIREYVLKPPGLRTYNFDAADVQLPKLIIITGTHGRERNSVITTNIFFRELLTRWDQDERLRDLRFGAQIVFVPCLAPTAADLFNQRNQNGVNINRNLPTGWATGGSDDPTQQAYRGPSPASENESQIAISLLTRHPDAQIIVDHHNWGSHDPGNQYIGWIGSNHSDTWPREFALLTSLDGYIRNEFPALGNPQAPLMRISNPSDGTVSRHFAAEGQRAFLLETPNAIYDDLTAARKFGVEMITRVMHSEWQLAIRKSLA